MGSEFQSSATDYTDHFSVENIPWGIATRKVSNNKSQTCVVTRVGKEVIFLGPMQDDLNIQDLPKDVLSQPTLNEFASLGRVVHRAVRQSIQNLVRTNRIPANSKASLTDVDLELPMAVGDFTDFSCSSHHNRRAPQALFGAAGDLPPGYLHMPLGYAGRSSSIQVSGTPVRRPRGQYFVHGIEGMQGKRTDVAFGPSQAMDFELEIGVIVGKRVLSGDLISAEEAGNHIFGFVLLNDWSGELRARIVRNIIKLTKAARDIQQLEMKPVGPLNSKHAATTISPWVISPDALEGYRVPLKTGKVELAPHLREAHPRLLAAIVEAKVSNSSTHRTELLCKTTSAVMDWTFEALLAHQSSSGCGLRAGDLLGIGTISGPGPNERGCLLEQFAAGNERERGYLEDNEEVQISAWCGQGVGFGECQGRIVPALDESVWSTSS